MFIIVKYFDKEKRIVNLPNNIKLILTQCTVQFLSSCRLEKLEYTCAEIRCSVCEHFRIIPTAVLSLTSKNDENLHEDVINLPKLPKMRDSNMQIKYS